MIFERGIDEKPSRCRQKLQFSILSEETLIINTKPAVELLSELLLWDKAVFE